jgi:DNA-binding NtrC family response regulator
LKVPPNRKILVIDDQTEICRGCRRIFKAKGCTVKTALSGGKGLERTKRERFDIIIIDLKLPDMSGLEVVKQVKQRKPDQPIVMITGYATVSTAVEATKLGVASFIAKPFEPEEIIDTVMGLLDKGNKTLTAVRTDSYKQSIIDKRQVVRVLYPHFELAKSSFS